MIFSSCGSSMYSGHGITMVSVKMISGSIVRRAIDAEKTDSNFQNHSILQLPTSWIYIY